jgi:uncharacterized membrane protein YdfJ with MMPL/SSD domain
VATFFALRLVANFVDLSVFALNLVTGLGLGLAIDYSLFMVSRYREEAIHSGFGLAALTRTLQTSGRTIAFSSITVAVAIASLALFPQRFLYSMGTAGALDPPVRDRLRAGHRLRGVPALPDQGGSRRGASDSDAVAIGLERTGRIVTAAAVLFAVAIVASATSEIVLIKELGIGTALAALIDASIIRALLVPSLMELLGP